MSGFNVGYVMKKVRFMPGGCVEWTGRINWAGYGVMHLGQGRSTGAHRYVWAMLRGELARGIQLDHLCRNRRCVNVGHLEPVTARENTMRSGAVSAINARKTECKNGHSLEDAYVYPPGTSSEGERACRACHRETQRRYLARRVR